MPDEHVPILIVGGSLVGLTTAMLLGHHGVPALAVERHAGTVAPDLVGQIVTLAYPFGDLVLIETLRGALPMRSWRIDARWLLLGDPGPVTMSIDGHDTMPPHPLSTPGPANTPCSSPTSTGAQAVGESAPPGWLISARVCAAPRPRGG
jgi:hypothetical protein